MPGLSAKVFRTYHASDVVRKYLKIQPVSQKDSEHKKKKVATLANLEAAKICNHMKQVPKNFKDRVSKQKERYNKSLERIKKLKEKFDLKENKIQEAKKKAIEVDFPWQKYYSTALQKKFSWLDESCNK